MSVNKTVSESQSCKCQMSIKKTSNPVGPLQSARQNISIQAMRWCSWHRPSNNAPCWWSLSPSCNHDQFRYQDSHQGDCPTWDLTSARTFYETSDTGNVHDALTIVVDERCIVEHQLFSRLTHTFSVCLSIITSDKVFCFLLPVCSILNLIELVLEYHLSAYRIPINRSMTSWSTTQKTLSAKRDFIFCVICYFASCQNLASDLDMHQHIWSVQIFRSVSEMHRFCIRKELEAIRMSEAQTKTKWLMILMILALFWDHKVFWAQTKDASNTVVTQAWPKTLRSR